MTDKWAEAPKHLRDSAFVYQKQIKTKQWLMLWLKPWTIFFLCALINLTKYI